MKPNFIKIKIANQIKTNLKKKLLFLFILVIFFLIILGFH